MYMLICYAKINKENMRLRQFSEAYFIVGNTDNTEFNIKRNNPSIIKGHKTNIDGKVFHHCIGFIKK